MNNKLKRVLAKEAVVAFFISACLVNIYLFRVIYLQEVPIASPTNITDPAPANLVFGPEAEMMRKIVKTNSSILWSETRDFGTPILFQEYPGSPLHPLAWIRTFLPYALRWRFNGVIIFFFIGLASFLIGRRIFRFGWPGSVIFTQI